MNQRFFWTVGLAVPMVVLGGGLAWMWLTPDMQLKNTTWLPPEPRKADIASLVPQVVTFQDHRRRDETLLLEMQERPLFAISRRPPPPPPPPAPPAEKKPEEPPDIWKQARLTGIFEGEVGGIIFSLDGKEQRLLVGKALSGWVLQSVQSRSAVVARGSQTRTLQLVKAAMDKGPNVPAGAQRVPPSARAAVQQQNSAASTPPAPPAPSLQSSTPPSTSSAPPPSTSPPASRGGAGAAGAAPQEPQPSFGGS